MIYLTIFRTSIGPIQSLEVQRWPGALFIPFHRATSFKYLFYFISLPGPKLTLPIALRIAFEHHNNMYG